MKYALAADVHGNQRHLEAVLAAARRHRAESTIIAGDYLECRVSKRAGALARARTTAEAVDIQPQLWRLLAGCVLVKGNQEERIARLIADLPTDPALNPLRPLLAAPSTAVVSSLRVMHGHTFDWSKCDGWWVPTLDEAVPGDRIIVYGHSHQELIVALPGEGTRPYAPSPARLGERVRLDGPDRYLINLAPVRDRPVWLLYDDETEEIAFHLADLP